MSCASGFDPYLDRDDAFVDHLASCPHCADVSRVLGAAASVWKEEAASDQARAVFRERRLSLPRATKPLRSTALGALVLLASVAFAVSSAWAFGHLSLRWLPPAMSPSPSPASEPTRVPTAPLAPAVATESREPEPSVSPPASSTLPSPPPPITKSAAELWAEGMTRLEHGDRLGASRLFERVTKAPGVDPALRHRAMFRIAEIELALGDTVTPRAALAELVRGPERMLGFDAALLLERCQPDARAAVWEAYLASPPDEPMRTQALARQRAALAVSPAGSSR